MVYYNYLFTGEKLITGFYCIGKRLEVLLKYNYTTAPYPYFVGITFSQ